jgi:toxin ParE1/3/4
MRVIIREAAYADLDRIYSWIAKDNPHAAQSVVDRILDSAELLGRNPYIGHVGRAPNTYEWVARNTPYIVVYTVDEAEDFLVVIAVFTARKIDRPTRYDLSPPISPCE